MDHITDQEKIERFDLVRQLSLVHPGALHDYNKTLANYTGGFVDDGDICWRQCLYKADISTLRDAVNHFKNRI